MKFKTEAECKCYEFYLNVKKYLNNGLPNVHLSKGCIGDLALFEEGKGMFIVQAEFNDLLGLKNELKRLGASDICMSETVDNEFVYIFDGVSFERCERSITIEFAVEQHESIKDKQNCSQAYRDIWDMVYRVARTEKYHDKNYKGENALYLANLILRATRNAINERAVNIDDVILMIEKTVDISLQDKTLPTLSELRRLEINKNAKFEIEETELVAAFGELLLKSKRATSPQQTWTLFYRAQRLAKSWRHHGYWLVNSASNSANSDYISKMKKCVTDIFYPKWVISKIGTRLCQLKLKSNNPLVLYTGNVADLIDDELPF